MAPASRQEGIVRATKIMANLHVADIEAAKGFTPTSSG